MISGRDAMNHNNRGPWKENAGGQSKIVLLISYDDARMSFS